MAAVVSDAECLDMHAVRRCNARANTVRSNQLSLKTRLQARFTGTSPLSKDVNDQSNSIKHWQPHSNLQVALLHGAECSVNKQLGRLMGSAGLLDVVNYTRTKVCGRSHVVMLGRTCFNVRAGCTCTCIATCHLNCQGSLRRLCMHTTTMQVLHEAALVYGTCTISEIMSWQTQKETSKCCIGYA